MLLTTDAQKTQFLVACREQIIRVRDNSFTEAEKQNTAKIEDPGDSNGSCYEVFALENTIIGEKILPGGYNFEGEVSTLQAKKLAVLSNLYTTVAKEIEERVDDLDLDVAYSRVKTHVVDSYSASIESSDEIETLMSEHRSTRCCGQFFSPKSDAFLNKYDLSAKKAVSSSLDPLILSQAGY